MRRFFSWATWSATVDGFPPAWMPSCLWIFTSSIWAVASAWIRPACIGLPRIRSPRFPFAALLKGMLNDDLKSREPRPIHLGGFFSVMARQMVEPPNRSNERFGDRSYAIISDRYMNFSSRVGYHYSVLDCYLGKTTAKNYINFQFKGGAADDVRRSRRARVIETVLIELGFLVNTVADRVTRPHRQTGSLGIGGKTRLAGAAADFYPPDGYAHAQRRPGE